MTGSTVSFRNLAEWEKKKNTKFAVLIFHMIIEEFAAFVMERLNELPH